jgi:hypothetical protein
MPLFNNTYILPGDKNAPTLITPNVPGYDTMKMFLACYKITKGNLSIEKSNVILINYYNY